MRPELMITDKAVIAVYDTLCMIGAKGILQSSLEEARQRINIYEVSPIRQYENDTKGFAVFSGTHGIAADVAKRGEEARIIGFGLDGKLLGKTLDNISKLIDFSPQTPSPGLQTAIKGEFLDQLVSYRGALQHADPRRVFTATQCLRFLVGSMGKTKEEAAAELEKRYGITDIRIVEPCAE